MIERHRFKQVDDTQRSGQPVHIERVTEFCEGLGITQSMSKAGSPYDNAPMERYFNTLKNDLICQHYYHTEVELYAVVEEFAYPCTSAFL